jgi:thiol-disulfide isomerase/thioredoxin
MQMFKAEFHVALKWHQGGGHGQKWKGTLVKEGGLVHKRPNMTKRLVLCVVVGVMVYTAVAETVNLSTLKVGNTTYQNVTVLGANTTDLYFKHSRGFANVKLKYVPAELQKRFDYNPKAAAEAERRQNEEEILYQNSLAMAAVKQPTNGGAARAIGALGLETGLADPISERSMLGKPGPSLNPDKWIGDKPSIEGKFVLLNFWATWSSPCRQAIPELNAMQKKYAEKLVVIGVSAEPESAYADFASPHIEYALAMDAKAKLSAACGVTSIPFVTLRDPKGTILYQGHPAALTDKKLQAILARASE